MTEVDIMSPGFPEDYPNNANCTWVVQHDCAESWTITAREFYLEWHPICGYDKLSFAALGVDEKFGFCGDSSGNYTGSSSSSEYEDSYEDYDNEITDNDGLISFTINGSEINISFESDGSIVRSGFDITISANLFDTCPGVPSRPQAQCDYFDNGPFFNPRGTAYYQPGFDIAVPFSAFSQSNLLTGTNSCVDECIETAGCFKTYYNDDSNTCELRGNEIEASALFENVYAVDGKYCDGNAGRVWIDGMTTTRVFCLFSFTGSADSYLEYLNRKNPNMLEWTTTKRVPDSGEQISSTQIWSFSIAEDRQSDSGTWYTFSSTTYFRRFLSDSDEPEERKRRDADSESLFEALAQAAAGQFINDLDTAAEGATVLETEEPEIETEVLEEVPQPQDIEFAAAFKDFFKIARAAMDALPRQPLVPMLAKTKQRFEWMTEFSDAPCAEYAGEGVGSGVDYVPPTIDAENICETIVSFHAALSGRVRHLMKRVTHEYVSEYMTHVT